MRFVYSTNDDEMKAHKPGRACVSEHNLIYNIFSLKAFSIFFEVQKMSISVYIYS